MLLSLITLLPMLESKHRVTSLSMVLDGVLSQKPNSILLRHNLSGITDVMKMTIQVELCEKHYFENCLENYCSINPNLSFTVCCTFYDNLDHCGRGGGLNGHSLPATAACENVLLKNYYQNTCYEKALSRKGLYNQV